MTRRKWRELEMGEWWTGTEGEWQGKEKKDRVLWLGLHRCVIDIDIDIKAVHNQMTSKNTCKWSIHFM